ncbi:MAG: glycosyltransferase family 2 protein [Burkholderiales bacterium]
MHKLALVVPTKDRPDDLGKLLSSLEAQTRLPDQLIVVDGSNPDIQHVIDRFPGLQVDYVRVYPPSLSQQRNAGMQRLDPEITLAGYLDDDIVLEPSAIEVMLRFWSTAGTDIGGAAFNITNAARPNWVCLKSLLLVDAALPGQMLPSGFPSTIGFQQVDIETDWLYGGATVWRREIADRYSYDEWFLGMGFLEDVDFSFRVRREYRLKVVSAARLAHYSHPIKPERETLLGKWQITNRMYLVRKHKSRGLSVGAAWIASAGTTLLNIALALFRNHPGHWRRAKGNFQGMFAEITGNRSALGGHLK